MNEEPTGSWIAMFRARLRAQSVIVRWVIEIPFYVTLMVAGVLICFRCFAENSDHSLPPELLIMAASFSVYLINVFVGMVMAAVLLCCDRCA